MDERRSPARPGSALERERAALRRQVRPDARALFEVLSVVSAIDAVVKSEDRS